MRCNLKTRRLSWLFGPKAKDQFNQPTGTKYNPESPTNPCSTVPGEIITHILRRHHGVKVRQKAGGTASAYLQELALEIHEVCL